MCCFISFFYIEADRAIYLFRTNHTPCRFSDSLCPFQAAIFKVGREGRRTYHAGRKFVCCLCRGCGRDPIVGIVDRPRGSLHRGLPTMLPIGGNPSWEFQCHPSLYAGTRQTCAPHRIYCTALRI
uniref:Uncharacterized protein n=1 Tax=Ixodes ricinus TaxID=34613 RepID=A0A6B0UP32_IXORI